MARTCTRITAWRFALGETEECLQHAAAVTVPHTWGVLEGEASAPGVGWYETEIPCPGVGPADGVTLLPRP